MQLFSHVRIRVGIFLAFLAFPFIVIMTYHLASVAALVGSDKLSKIIGCWYDLCLNIDLAF